MMRLLLLISLVFFCFHSSAQTVYKTPSGKKYHVAHCRMVKNVSEAMDVKVAVEEGLGPCSICTPLTATPQTLISKKPKGDAKSTTQCLGYTKARLRCKHMTSIGNGYCYQHQP